MSAILSALVGPLALPECKRASRRESSFVLRPILAIVLGLVVLAVAWYSDVIVRQFLGDSLPFYALILGLHAIETLSVLAAIVLAPAFLAGSLAGERERGALGLLLTTRVNGFEVVMGRLAGKLCPVAFALLGGLPLSAIIAAQTGTRPATLAAIWLLPIAVAFGGGGLALAASSMSKRGRNALLLVYLLDLVFLFSPLIADALSSFLEPFPLGRISPLDGEMLTRLVWVQDLGPAWTTIAIWTFLGIFGVALASRRIRPATLNAAGGQTRRGKSSRRAWIVPPVRDDPMLWKEIFIERAGSIGLIGKILRISLVVYLLGSSAYVAYYHMLGIRLAEDGYLRISENAARDWIGNPSWSVAVLIVVSIGLRASTTIAGERERGTWDSILTSPLEGSAIVRGKLWGSVHALRWLILAALAAWTVACVAEGIAPGSLAGLIAQTLVVAVFAATIGIRSSLTYSTATRAMSATIVLLLVVHFVVAALSAVVVLTSGLFLFMFLGLLQAIPFFISLSAKLPSFSFFWHATLILLYISITIFLVASTALRFDRLAGRMTGGRWAGAVDRFFAGGPIVDSVAVDYLDAKST